MKKVKKNCACCACLQNNLTEANFSEIKKVVGEVIKKSKKRKVKNKVKKR